MRMRIFVFTAVAALIGACAQDNEPTTQGQGLESNVGNLEAGPEGTACTEDGVKVACYTGPVETAGIGSCKVGQQACIGGKLTACTEITPTDEVCDGQDNDCNGETDDGLGETSCGEGECATVVDNCVAGVEVTCEWESLLKASPEMCDGLDNDCDGKTDEQQDDTAIEVDCYTGPEGTEGVGLCAGGTNTCVNGELAGCEGETLPDSEVCDGLDNDCDGGDPDEDFVNLGNVCTVGKGECENSGDVVCNDEMTGEVCSVTPGDPTDETCDSLDNDCDGSTDEDADDNPLAQDCYTGPEGTQGVGACAGGTSTCTDGSYAGCEGETTPTDEACDGLDNDCDSSVDENTEGGVLMIACYTGPDGTSGEGQCGDGVQVCAGGSLLPTCFGQTTPADAEVCFDLVDNNCDGEVDENCTVPCTDEDQDGYGEGCALGADCDDTDVKVNPAEPEWCGNSTDDNCNGFDDELGCYSAGAGAGLVLFKSTGVCAYNNLFFVDDFAAVSSPHVALNSGQDGFSALAFYHASGSGTDGLKRFNIEFDADGQLGNDLWYISTDTDGPVVHDECGSVRVFYEGTELDWDAFHDPRPVPAPFAESNVFVCFGSQAGCLLCGGDYDGNGTPDCDEDGGYCAGDVADNAACGD